MWAVPIPCLCSHSFWILFLLQHDGYFAAWVLEVFLDVWPASVPTERCSWATVLAGWPQALLVFFSISSGDESRCWCCASRTPDCLTVCGACTDSAHPSLPAASFLQVCTAQITHSFIFLDLGGRWAEGWWRGAYVPLESFLSLGSSLDWAWPNCFQLAVMLLG